MADQTFRIDVIVDPQKAVAGTKKVEKALDKTTKSAENFQSKVSNAFKFGIGGLTAGLAVRKVVQLADTFTALENRLRLVTRSTVELRNATDSLFSIAQRTRSSFAATGEFYVRLNIAAKDLGRSQKELLRATETVNKAIILSGTTAQEARAGLIQLSQGLAFGALRGDELRSVMEQLPGLANLLATELGVTRGELLELGRTGQLTSDKLLNAFVNQSELVDAAFKTTNVTIGQALENLNTSFIELVANFDDATDASGTLASGITFLSENLEDLVKVLGVVVASQVGTRLTALSVGVLAVGDATEKATKARKASVAVDVNKLRLTRLEAVQRKLNLKALADQTRGTIAYTEVKNQLVAAEARELLATTRLRDARASLAATTKTAAAATGASLAAGTTRALRGASAAASGLLSALGGVPGIAIGATTAIVLYRKELGQLLGITERLTEAQEREKKSLTDLNQEFLEALRLSVRIRQIQRSDKPGSDIASAVSAVAGTQVENLQAILEKVIEREREGLFDAPAAAARQANRQLVEDFERGVVEGILAGLPQPKDVESAFFAVRDALRERGFDFESRPKELFDPGRALFSATDFDKFLLKQLEGVNGEIGKLNAELIRAETNLENLPSDVFKDIANDAIQAAERLRVLPSVTDITELPGFQQVQANLDATERDFDLKLKLLQRGFSPELIERVKDTRRQLEKAFDPDLPNRDQLITKALRDREAQLIRIQQKQEDGLRVRDEAAADRAIGAEIRALTQENQLLDAKGDKFFELQALQIAQNAQLAAGLKNTDELVGRDDARVQALAEQLKLQEELNSANRQDPAAEAVPDLLRRTEQDPFFETTRSLQQQLELAKAFSFEQNRIRATQEVINQERRQGIALSDEERQRRIEDLTSLQNELDLVARTRDAGNLVADSLISPLQQALAQGDFEDIGKAIGISLATSIADVTGDILRNLLGQLLGSAFGSIIGGGAAGRVPGASIAQGGGAFGGGPPLRNAKGNVFSGGRVVKRFRRGGILTRAQKFPLGLAGEAGPEAFVPLTDNFEAPFLGGGSTPLARGPGGNLMLAGGGAGSLDTSELQYQLNETAEGFARISQASTQQQGGSGPRFSRAQRGEAGFFAEEEDGNFRI